MKRGLVHVGVPMGPQSFTERYAEEFFEKKESLVKVLSLDAALAVTTQVLNPSCFYLANNLFPEKLLEIYTHQAVQQPREGSDQAQGHSAGHLAAKLSPYDARPPPYEAGSHYHI